MGTGYPRPGFRLAPLALRELLDVPVPDGVLDNSRDQSLHLCDLSETVWSRFDHDTCNRLAEAVVDRVREKTNHLYSQSVEPIYSRVLPPSPEGLALEDLELGNWTLAVLRRAGIKTARDLNNLTIGSLLGLTAFGAKSLVDLLTALESAEPPSQSARGAGDGNVTIAPRPSSVGGTGTFAAPGPRLDRRLTREAQRIRRRKYANQVRRDDPRLGDLIREVIGAISSKDKRLSGKTTTLFNIADYLVGRSRDPRDPGRVLGLLRKLNYTIQVLSAMRLEDELKSIVGAATDERRARIICRLFGWDGNGGCTLQAAGDEIGLSRERVRQISSKFADKLMRNRVFTPILDRALRIIAKHVPDAEEIQSQLIAQGLTGREFRMEGMSKACMLMNRRTTFAFDTMAEASILIGRIGRKAIEHWGVASIADIANRVSMEMSQRISAEFVARVLRTQPDFRWLDEGTGWFWLADTPRNRLLNQIEKILSIANRIGASELREGASRHYRLGGFAPPRRVLLELCRQIPGCKVQNETVSIEPPIDYKKVLAETERAMAQTLRVHGPVMRRSDFEELCVKAGMNRSTFYVYLDNSPIIARYAPGVYGLRGASITPAEIQALIPERKPQKVIVDNGWTADAQIWIGAKLSRAALTSGVLGTPSGLKRFIQGQFALKADDGMIVGKLGSRGGSVWGLGPFFTQRGGEPGDYLTIVFDLTSHVAVVRIGDESILDRFRGGSDAGTNTYKPPGS